ncbi:hypothetical protein P389DRAFT_35743 [Cystobasidium minutum MCA 4210]|uniref:uncharacterized protein n=1 Tax=Cystobasidium minutum MCA 4210 TaxID=1397322 RepID=UPI0034CDC4BA|eukprot:jgi/Rhomi1/35743/CE35742_982
MLRTLIASTLLLAGLAQAGLSDMRATIPGSLHQCENTTVFFFDTDDSGSKTLLFVNAADASKLGSDTITLDDALSKVEPLQQISDINSADAAAFSFYVKVAEDVSFSTFGFLSNGQGKNMNLDRTVKDPLPGATECLSQVSAPATTSASVPVVASSKTSSKASSSSAAPSSSTSGFVKALKASSSSSSSSASSASSVPVTPPAASSAPASSAAPVAAQVNASSTAAAPAATGKSTIIETNYLLSSFIVIASEQTTDGTVSSAAIQGGHITGSFNGTILPVGTALFSPNSTVPAGAAVGNATTSDAAADKGTPILLSATYTFTIDDGKYAGDAVFVMGQTPLSVNSTVPALLMHLQPAVDGLGAKWVNKTVLGKPTFINSTMFRLDAYVAEQ